MILIQNPSCYANKQRHSENTVNAKIYTGLTSIVRPPPVTQSIPTDTPQT